MLRGSWLYIFVCVQHASPLSLKSIQNMFLAIAKMLAYGQHSGAAGHGVVSSYQLVLLVWVSNTVHRSPSPLSIVMSASRSPT